MRMIGIIPLLFACGEQVIEKQNNSAPIVVLVSHSDGVEVQEGYVESFRATVSDDDNEFSELQIVWYVGEEVVCDWAEVSPAGDSTCQIVFDPSDANVIVEARDPNGAGGRTEIEIIVLPTEAPTAQILSPVQSSGYYANELIQFSALVSDNEDAPEDLLITWTSSLDGELILDTTPDASGTISDYTYLTEGQHALELRVEDSSGKITKEQLVLQVGGANSIPTCEILEPVNQSAVVSEETILFTALVGDENIPATELSTRWTSDKDGELGGGSVTSSGEASLLYSDLSVNDHLISLVVEDEVGALCQDDLILHVGTPPTALIEEPLDGEVYSIGEYIIFRGVVSDTEDSSNEISVLWSSSLDGELMTGNASSQGISQFSTAGLTAGMHSISFTATDTTGLIADDLVTFRVNTPPTAPTINLTPDPILGTEQLIAIASGSLDPDGDSISYLYEWYENSVLTTFSTSTIPPSELEVGEIWTVRVTPNDGQVDGDYAEATITISNSEPTVDSGLLSSSDGAYFYTDSTLTCLGTVSDDDETVSAIYSWDINGSSSSGAAVDLSSYSLAVGDSVSCTISVADSHGGVDSMVVSEVIDNRDPSIASVSITPNLVQTNSLLSCSVSASDDDNDFLTESYSWTINGSSVGSASTLQLDNSLASPFDTVECTVSVDDGNGGSISDSISVSVSNTDPSIDSISLTPLEPRLTDSLTCAVTGSDIDGDTPNFSFSFSNQTTGITYTATSTSTTEASLDLDSIVIQAEDVVVCEVTATDLDNGSAVDSASVPIINSAPIFDQPATITPGSPVLTETELTCSASATDPDGGSIAYSYSWQINGQAAATGTSFTVTEQQTNAADVITCLVIAVDLDAEMSSSTSAPVVIQNSAPEIDSVSLNTLSPDTATALEVTVTASDIDGDAINITLEWHVIDEFNNDSIVLISTGQSPSLPETFFTRDQRVYVLVTPDDGADFGTSVPSDYADVINTAPTAAFIALSSAVNPPIEGADDLNCEITNIATDLDNDSITYTFNWYDDSGSSTPIQSSGATTSSIDSLSGTLTTPGVWTCEVIASDGSLDTTVTETITVDSDWAGAITFTTCGQTGTDGPSQSQCDSEYSGSNLDGEVIVSSGIQEWVVPSDGTYEIEVAGAEGGDVPDYSNTPGTGATIIGTFSLTQGEILNIVVAQQGGDEYTAGHGGGGGGGSFIYTGSIGGNGLLIAAGGGAGECEDGGCNGPDGTATTSASNNCGSGIGYGGGSSGGGGGGAGWLSDGDSGNSGSGIGYGGTRWVGGASGSSGFDNFGGFGGGGGANDNESGGGGGYTGGCGSGNNGSNVGSGGSFNGGTNQSNTAGGNTGQGYIIIDKL